MTINLSRRSATLPADWYEAATFRRPPPRCAIRLGVTGGGTAAAAEPTPGVDSDPRARRRGALRCHPRGGRPVRTGSRSARYPGGPALRLVGGRGPRLPRPRQPPPALPPPPHPHGP